MKKFSRSRFRFSVFIMFVFVAIFNPRARADTFAYSYSFSAKPHPIVTGTFEGTQNGNIISGISNITLSINGASVGPVFAATFKGINWIAGSVVSIDGTANNFKFTDSDYVNGVPYSYSFDSITGLSGWNRIGYSTGTVGVPGDSPLNASWSVTKVSGPQQTAAVLATAKSFQLLPANPLFVSGFGNIYTYFSTFNGTTGAFLTDSKGNMVSGEVRPRLNAPGIYEGAYGQTTLLQNYDYGSFALTVPLTDNDGDGVPDFMQVSRATNVSTSGNGYSMGVASPFSITIAMSRSANSAAGTYSATTQISGSAANTVTGSFLINGFTGNLSYTRGISNSMALALTSLATGKSNSGSTTYTISNGGDSLNYGAFDITDADGIVYHVMAGSLSRSGSTYRGTMSLTDGMPQTYWVDFRDFWVSIADSHDANGNGIPDLTDALPVIVAPSNAVITITVQ